jgi:membrane-anchored protein YejM (alkaline phosphatase superfamily)
MNNSDLRFSTLFWFLVSNFILSLVISSSYLNFVPDSITLGEWSFSRLAYISNFALLFFVLSIPLFVTTALIPSMIFMRVASSALFLLFNIILFVDTLIYKLYRFHINGLVWNILVTEGSSDSVKVSTSTIVAFSFYLFLIILTVVGTHYLLSRFLDKMPQKYSGRRLLSFLLLGFFCINLIDKPIYAHADLNNKTHITRYAKLFPLYQPLTVKRLAQQWGIDVNREFDYKLSKSSGMMNYPLEDIEVKDSNDKPNIIFITVDSWRYDLMDKEVTPIIHEFSENAWVFNNHYSGGNSTRFGIFSMFYGIYGSYWHTILSERTEPVLMEKLREKNYNFGIWSSADLSWPEFRKTTFIGTPNQIYDRIPGKGAKVRDLKQPDLFNAWLDSVGTDNPFFAYFLLDAPHEPYSYPDEFVKFEPSVNEINYMSLDKHVDMKPFYNHYKNAVYFSDHVIGKFLQIIKQRDLLKNSIIIITSDHGAEFYEHGYWGHNSAFTKEQVMAPFIIYIPGQAPKKVESLTTHLDIAPTLLELIGSSKNHKDHSFGLSLLSDEANTRNYVVSSGWGESAIITDDATLVFSTETYNLNTFEIRDNNYELMAGDRYSDFFSGSDVNEVIINMGKFLK